MGTVLCLLLKSRQSWNSQQLLLCSMELHCLNRAAGGFVCFTSKAWIVFSSLGLVVPTPCSSNTFPCAVEGVWGGILAFGKLGTYWRLGS
jgi:hypothetical protein